MVSVTRREKKELKRVLAKTKNRMLQNALRKLAQDTTKEQYERERGGIRKLLGNGYRTRQRVKIRYYSLSSDESRFREVSIYHLTKEYVFAYCHLREDIRKFAISRISAARMTGKAYTIPKSFNAKDY